MLTEKFYKKTLLSRHKEGSYNFPRQNRSLHIYFLSLQEVIRFSQLRRSLPEISERMLVRQLRELEEDGLVHRKVYGTVPPRVDYSLTPLGVSLVPIMESLKTWGNMYETTRGQDKKTDEATHTPEPALAPADK